MHRSLLPILLLCACPRPQDTSDSGTTPGPLPQITTPADGWLRGDLHLHTTYSDGWDEVPAVIEMAEYLTWPEFLAFNPEFQDNSLDFLALSDHRTVDQDYDAGFDSDLLIMVPSEEFGSSGHANVPGVSSFVDHDPDGDGVSTEDIQAGVDATHAQGAVFSANHPYSPDIMFPWDVEGIDTIEVWNSGWLLASPPTTEQDLADWEASRGAASATYRRGIQAAGRGASGQALTWVEALLSRGQHPGLVGGSDRHAIVLPGFPTTYVEAESADLPGVIDAMASRRSFVTRSPISAQLLGTISVDGAEYGFGDQVPVPPGGAEVTISVQVARAEGGLVRLLQGGQVASDEDLEATTLSVAVAEESIDGPEHLLEHSFRAEPGDWLYPLVLEPLFAPGISEEQQQLVLDTATMAAESGADAMNIATAVAPLLDTDLLANPDDCDPEDWQPDMLQCSLADMDGLASFYIPDMLDRAMNAWMEDSQVTGYCMGAVASAVVFVEE